MKVFIYLALIVAFLMFYQYNPVFSILIVLIGIGMFLYFRSRKKGKILGRGTFFSGRGHQQNDQLDDLATIILLQNLFNNPSNNPSSISLSEYEPKKVNNKREDEIDKIKKEVLKLLES